jgi:branched-chain amino acid aminotransferase
MGGRGLVRGVLWPDNVGMDEPQAFFNGRWIAASAAAIPVGDAGFVLGATVAEQLRTFGGRLFRLEDHLARLQQSLHIVGVDPGMPVAQVGGVARELAARNHRLLVDPARWGVCADAIPTHRRGYPGDDLGLSILVTPGPYPAYAPPGPASPTVCLHTYPLPFHLWAEKYRWGEALVSSDVEQISPRSWPPGLKCRSRMHYYLADQRAGKPGGLQVAGRVDLASA